MTTPAQLDVWAGRILEGLGDTTTPQSTVVSWLQYNLPKLNLTIDTDFTLTSGCINEEMTFNQSGIYEEMFYCDYLRKRAMSLLGGSTFKDVVEVEGDEQGRIRWVSFNERAKTYKTLANDCAASLKDLVDWYLSASGASCYQILYNLRDDPAGYGLKQVTPPGSFYRSYNSVWTRETPY